MDQKPRRLRVLLAEDNEVNRLVATTMLEKAGHEVVSVGSGDRAVEEVMRGGFDIVVMDVHMPEMDGMEATAAIRREEKGTGSHTPVVALTALASKGDEEELLAAGVDRYLSKPVKTDELLRCLDELCETAGAVAEGGGEPGRSCETPVDLTEFREMMSDDVEVIEMVVATHLRTYRKRFEKLNEAFEDGNAPEVRSAAHSIKGALSSLAAGTAMEIVRQVERCGENGTLEEVSSHLSRLEAELEVVADFLRAQDWSG